MAVWVTGPGFATGVRWWGGQSHRPDTSLEKLLNRWKAKPDSLEGDAQEASKLRGKFGLQSVETRQFFEALQR